MTIIVTRGLTVASEYATLQIVLHPSLKGARRNLDDPRSPIAASPVSDDEPGAGLRARPGARIQARQRARHAAHRAGPGGGAGGHRREPAPHRLLLPRPSLPRPALPGRHAGREDHGRVVRQGHGRLLRQGRLAALGRCQRGQLRRQRHRRLDDGHRARRGAGLADAEDRPGRRGHRRRRHLGPRGVAREHEPGGHLEGSAPVLLRQ